MIPMIERKIRYDGSVVEYGCNLLECGEDHAVLLYNITNAFTISEGQASLTVPSGSYTVAFYWVDRPYNVYMMSNENGEFLGAYVNIVRNTVISDGLVSFEDMIIDLLVLPSGDAIVLDEDELPQPLDQFENGTVRQALSIVLDAKDSLVPQLLQDAKRFVQLVD